MTMTIGIDISKDWLDVDRFPDAPGGVGKARFANSASGHAALVAWLEEFGDAPVTRRRRGWSSRRPAPITARWPWRWSGRGGASAR